MMPGLARVALSLLVEPGNRALWLSVAAHGPVPVLEQLLASEHDRRTSHALGLLLEPAGVRQLAEATLARIRRLGGRVVIPEDDQWPHQLDDLIDVCDPDSALPIDRDAAPPLCLWVRGPRRLDTALDRSVAVMGARAATECGTQVARQLGHRLASAGWTVGSGGAYGVEEAAHRGALDGGGVTVAVLACGVDVTHPAGHARLFERIAEEGLLVSEWPPQAQPLRQRVLARSCLIAAAARGTVAIDARARGSARLTLRRAEQLGRRRLVTPDCGVAIEVSHNPATGGPLKITDQCAAGDRADPQVHAVPDPSADRDPGVGGAR